MAQPAVPTENYSKFNYQGNGEMWTVNTLVRRNLVLHKYRGKRRGDQTYLLDFNSFLAWHIASWKCKSFLQELIPRQGWGQVGVGPGDSSKPQFQVRPWTLPWYSFEQGQLRQRDSQKDPGPAGGRKVQARHRIQAGRHRGLAQGLRQSSQRKPEH